MTDLLCLFLPADAEAAPDGWRDAYGDAVARAAADARTSKAVVVAYPREGAEAERVAVVPLSEDREGAERWRWGGAAAAKRAARLRVGAVTLAAPDAGAADALAEGFRLGGYRFDRYRTAPDAPPAVELRVRLPDGGAADVSAAEARAAATNAARDLVNVTPADKMPADLAEAMREGAEAAGLRVEVWDRARIEEEGLGGLLAVNRGSVDPPRFVVVEHAPEGHRGEAPVVLVGKGVTYDTGGLSLKPTKDSMDKMKADMGGAAAVYGAMLGAAGLGLGLRLVALIPMTDNRPGVRAYAPGDVVAMHSGATVEVLNTDAEGRMLLADGLSLARRYAPRLVVDVATLTGAQGVALGERVGALVTRDDEASAVRAARFVAAGRETGDLVWPLPLFPHYRRQLKSDVSDLKNVGGRMAGAITAAAFLEHFTHDPETGEPAYPWVHLDIARPAFLGAAYGYRPKHATGFGVRLLLRALADEAGAAPADTASAGAAG